MLLCPKTGFRLLMTGDRSSMTGFFFSSEVFGQLVGASISGAILTRANNNYVPLIAYSGSIMSKRQRNDKLALIETLFSSVLGSLFGITGRLLIQRKIFATV